MALSKIEAPALDVGQIGGRRNLVINGGFQISQRGTSFSGVGSAIYTLDRFRGIASGADATVTQVSGATYPYALRITGQASTTDTYIQHRIEAENCKHIAGQNVTLSVNIRGSAAKTATVTLYYPNTADTYGGTTSIASDTFSVTTTDTRFTSTFAIPSAATTGLQIQLKISSQGSDWVEWSALQLEVGSVATPFEHRSYGEELALCQRYYTRYSSSATNTAFGPAMIGTYNTTTALNIVHQHVVPMRSGATFGYSALSDFDIEPWDLEPTAMTIFSHSGPTHISLVITDPVAHSLGDCGVIACDTNGGYYEFDAEL